jgi:hypothetical protein
MAIWFGGEGNGGDEWGVQRGAAVAVSGGEGMPGKDEGRAADRAGLPVSEGRWRGRLGRKGEEGRWATARLKIKNGLKFKK